MNGSIYLMDWAGVCLIRPRVPLFLKRVTMTDGCIIPSAFLLPARHLFSCVIPPMEKRFLTGFAKNCWVLRYPGNGRVTVHNDYTLVITGSRRFIFIQTSAVIACRLNPIQNAVPRKVCGFNPKKAKDNAMIGRTVAMARPTA